MSVWNISCVKCSDTWVENIEDLLDNHRDEKEMFRCGHCGGPGYIHKKFKSPDGTPFEPHLRGAMTFKVDEESPHFRQFIFLVSWDQTNDRIGNLFFTHYTDYRPKGYLKMSYGPGGPTIYGIDQVVDAINRVEKLKILR